MSYALNGKRGNRDDGESETFIVASALTENNMRGKSRVGADDANFVVAAPLSHGSNPNSNAAGHRREDDYNLVAYALEASDGHHGYSSPRGDGADNLVTAFHQTQDPIHGAELSPGMGVERGASVRRLTPTECMRLQGLPDDWFDGVHSPDSRVYAGLGDAVTANVGFWLGSRISAVDEAGA